MADAAETFSILFFGGIAAGIVMGFVLRTIMTWLRRWGYVNTIIHVMYEVLTPFLLFMAAEEIHVSGILAVVAAGSQEHHRGAVPQSLALCR